MKNTISIISGTLGFTAINLNYALFFLACSFAVLGINYLIKKQLNRYEQ